MKRLRLWLLKRKARSLAQRYFEQVDHYSCGLHLAEYINPELKRMKAKLDAMLDKVAQGR